MPLSRRSLISTLLGLSLTLPTFAASPSARLADLAERYYRVVTHYDPVNTTIAGDHRLDDQLTISIAPAERQRRFAQLRRLQGELQRLPRQGLNADDALTAELLARGLRGQLAFEPFPDHLLPLQQMDSVPLVVASFASGQAGQPLDTVAQHQAYLRRLARLPDWLRQAEANLRQGLQQGVVQSRPVMAASLPALRALAGTDFDKHPCAVALQQLPAGASPAQRAALAAQYRQLVLTRLAPAIQRLVSFIERDYLPRTRDEAVGWSALPEGKAWYAQWVREQTTTELSPDAIHQMGLEEVARIQAGLAALAPALGAPQGVNVLAWAEGQPRFKPFKTEAEVLAAYEAINQRIAPQLPRLFGRAPKAPLAIRPEPELTRATASDNYKFSQEGGHNLGVYWAVINDPKDYSQVHMTSLFLHEGQPGHHFQIALQAEQALPEFRKRGWINAYGEGWALYAETLGHELGLYRDDPVALLGHYQLETTRAARLVVDTGLHDRGWSYEQAVTYWMDTLGADRPRAERAINRYLAWPGQALGYKVGALQIQALRRQAEARLGARFKLADFHDQVLGAGGLPLSLLDERIQGWLQSQDAVK